MSAVTWRDRPDIIWQHEEGHRIRVTVDGELITEDRWGRGFGEDCPPPSTPDGWDELLHRLAAAGGRRIVGIEDMPRPIAEGDRVAIDAGLDVFRVVHVDGDAVLLRRVKDDRPWIAWRDHLVHVDDPEPADEPEWVITRDPGEVAAALDAERTIEFETVSGWHRSDADSDEFRAWHGPLDQDYRYEGPPVAVPEASDEGVEGRCTPENRLCGRGVRCWGDVDGYHSQFPTRTRWYCSRVDCHEGPCVPCLDPGSDHLVDHNLHLREVDR